MTFDELMLTQCGYETKTTFWSDFTIADAFGTAAIIDTFCRAFKEWHKNIVYLTELALVLNHKIWFWYDRNETIAEVYDHLWRGVDNYCHENLTGEDAEYYFRVTD